MKSQTTNTKENVMRKFKITKLVLSAGAVDKDLEKARKLLELMSGMKAKIVASRKRIPTFNVRPGLEVGVCVTIRGEKAITLLSRLLGAVDNVLKKKQATQDQFSFGIKEYIEIPGMEYQRDIGIRGLNVTVVFARAGLRAGLKKIKRAKHIPKRQHVSPKEILNYMEENFKTVFN